MTDGPTLPDWVDDVLHLSTGRDGGAHVCVDCDEPINVYPAGTTAVLTCGCTPRLQLLIDRGADPEAVREALRAAVREGDTDG